MPQEDIIMRRKKTGSSTRVEDAPVRCTGGGPIQIRSKIWIEVQGKPVFGSGRRRLLEAIERTGSINRAAVDVHIPYRKAWGHIAAMEKRLGLKLVEKHVGGRHGGGTVLTDEARRFLSTFEKLEKGVDAFVDRRFQQTFGKELARRVKASTPHC